MTDDGTGRRLGRCDAKTRGGGHCRKPAGWGTIHPGVGSCKLHSGSTPNGEKSAQTVILHQAAEKFGIARSVDPGAAIVESIHKAAGQLDYYDREVNDLPSPWVEQRGPGGSSSIEEHPAVTAYQHALDRLFSFAERAVKLGLAERAITTSELQAAIMAQAMLAMIDDPDFGLSREQREIGRRVAGRHIRQLSAGSAA